MTWTDRVMWIVIYAAVCCCAVLMGLTAPLWAAEPGIKTYTLAVLHLDQGRPRYLWVDEAKCEEFVAEQEARTLFVEDVNLPRTRVVMVECQCVQFDADGNELTQ